MATETNDKYPHKPSAKHTLEEVRKSLEDLVRNEFDDVEPAPQPVQGTEADATPATPENDKARRSLSNLPRRKPAGLDTTQLLRSLKGLISDELSAGDAAPARSYRGDEDTVVEPDDEPVSTASAGQESLADQDAFSEINTRTMQAAPAPAVPASEPEASEAVAARRRENETADEGEEMTLEVAPVPEQALAPDADSEEPVESPLEALEKVTETLGEASPTSSIPTEGGERAPASLAPEKTARDTSGPTRDPTPEPWSQLPLLKVVDLPETAGAQRAFTVQDPVFAGAPGRDALSGKGQLSEAVPVPQAPPMFISQWLDEDPARQATDPGLGLFAEETDAAMEPPSAPATPTREEVPTGDQEEPAPVAGADTGAQLTGIDEETADTEPTRESSADQAGRDEMDMLEIPGGDDVVDEDTAEAEIILPAADIDDTEAKAIELTLEAPEETPMPNEIPNADADEQADIDLSAESVDEPDTAIDRPAGREPTREKPSSLNTEQEAGPTTSATPRAPEVGRRDVKREHRTTLGQADNSFMKMTAIDFNAEPSPAEEESSGTTSESPAPPFDSEPDLAVQAGESDVELPPPDEPKETVETPPSPPLSLVEESSPNLHSKHLKAKETVETSPSPPSSPAQESSPAARSKVADEKTVASKRPRADSAQPRIKTQPRTEQPSVKSKSGKLELTLEPDEPAGQDAAQQTQPASGVPEWYRRPFKFEQVAPVTPPAPRTKAPSKETRTKPKSAAFGAPDKIPVLDAVVTGRERPKTKPPAVKPGRERPKAKAPAVVPAREPPKAKTVMTGSPAKATPLAEQKAGRRDSAAARSLAIQIVAKLNMELRKCGERALSPAIVDRLQYLLREALAQGGSDVDNRKNKKF
jgi:hypothetical protein